MSDQSLWDRVFAGQRARSGEKWWEIAPWIIVAIVGMSYASAALTILTLTMRAVR